jgi:hypothetical protein
MRLTLMRYACLLPARCKLKTLARWHGESRRLKKFRGTVITYLGTDHFEIDWFLYKYFVGHTTHFMDKTATFVHHFYS